VIYVAPGASFEAVVQGFPTGLTGTIGVRIRDNQGADALARTTAGIAEDIANSGIYRVTLIAPSTAGQYSIVWDDGSISGPSDVAVEELVVTHTAPTAALPLGSDLITLQRAKEYLGNDGDTSAAEDNKIQGLISGISRRIGRHTGRQFVPKDPPSDGDPEVTHSFRYDGGGFLQLAPYEARSVSEVKLDGTVIAATTYSLEPYGKNTDGTYTWMILPLRDYTLLQLPLAGVVDLKGRFGIGSVPSDVELACLIEVDRRWLNPEGSEDRQLGGFSFSDDDGPLSGEAAGLLEPFCVVVSG
jgi:hypothetical protein